ncbi:acyl-CoA dehydrogenase family protein [Paractinoplanes toevensis]|uniref:Acyl-CoA dehydrogenase n=1 Tax=Paractinoplanes toevensis TaxID=571911 RepID=A0A919WBJ0_9ACTN|nr:acyl-CoA dehydrogenase family protein [Actinoplanes toevensis]GIM97043.1 acyl-CoA dehydrogenase [Actinoplanes toevensis]
MNLTLSAGQRAAAARFDELFGEDMRDDLRRMGNRELGAGAIAPLDEDETDVRQAVWQTFCELGGLRGLTVAEQVVVAEKVGAALYQSPWADTAVAIELAAAAGHDDLGARMTDGEAVAVAVRERTGDEPDRPGRLDLDGGVHAVRQFVAFAADVSWFLLAGVAAAGPRLLLVPGDHPGVTWRRHDDIGRGDFYEVTFRGVPVADVVELAAGAPAADAWAAALVTARIRHAAQLVGAAQAALDETVAYTRERRQFGQPVGSFQGPAFRMADLSTRVHAARLLTCYAAWLADEGDDARLAAYEALATAADLVRSAGTEAVQLHGAVGMTEEHDAQLFYRRAAVDALLWGRPTELRRAAAALLTEAVRRR